MKVVNFKSNLPPDWEVVKLGEISEKMKAGGTPSTSEEKYWDGKIAFTLIEDLVNSRQFLTKTNTFITKEGLKNSNSWIVPENSIILSLYATVGKPVINRIPVAITQNMLGIIPHRKVITTEFLFYALEKSRNTLWKYIDVSVHKHITASEAKNILIALPPLSEQQKIVYVLDRIQEAIEVQEKLIEKTKELKRAMMAKLFREGTRNEKLKKTEIGEIPESWEVVEIGQILDYEQPGEYIVKEKILEVKTENSIPVLTANKAFVLGYTNEADGIYRDVPVIIFDDFTTDKKFVDFPFKVKSSAIKILKLRDRRMNLMVIFEILSKIKFSHSGEHKRYYLSEYQKIRIPLPSSPEQREIADILQTIDQKIEIEQKKKALYEELFRAMLTKLMTGEIRVKDINFE